MSAHVASAASSRAAELEKSLRRVIRGKDEVVRLALVSIFAKGHLLIEGVPGVGKTTLGQALARAIDCSFQRIQFTSDMLPSDVLGISIYSAIEQKFEFKRGPVFANVLLADEINRTTPKTQSALLEAMNEGQVTIDAHSYQLPQPFLVLATQNPIEHHGTYPLPESQLDRFLMRVRMDTRRQRRARNPPRRSRSRATRKPAPRPQRRRRSRNSASRSPGPRRRIAHHLPAEHSYENPRVRISFSRSFSPGSQMLYRAAQAMAFLEGRDYCTPEDFKPLVVSVFAHRVVVSSLYTSTLKKSEQAEQVLREIVESVPVPV